MNGVKMKVRENYTCPLEIVHDIIKGKWKTIIIYQLKNGNSGLSQLEKKIQGINQKMLLEQLNELKEFGLVDKKTFEGYPLHVEYYLTERGKRALEAVQIMQSIGVEYMVEHEMTDVLDKKGICYHI